MTKITKKRTSLKASVLPFHIEADKVGGSFSLSCSGVNGIKELSDKEIKIDAPAFSLVLVGERLRMAVLENKCVEIIGKISEVRFIYDKA